MPDMSGFIDALIELFGASQDVVPEDAQTAFGSSVYRSIFRDQSAIGQNLIESLNGGEAGLYALVLSNRASYEQQQAISENSVWNYLTNVWNNGNTEETEEDPARSLTNILNFPEYYVFILSRSNQENPIPTVVSSNENFSTEYIFLNLEAYPVARMVSKRFKNTDLKSGSLIKVQYENAQTRDLLSVIDIVETDEKFTGLVMASLEAKSAQSNIEQCATDSILTGVTHPSGDPVAGSDLAVDLHNAYMQLERQAGVNQIDVSTLYTLLKTAFEQVGINDNNLIVGILANAKKESGFDSNIVSRVATESSIGLWQFNVQNPGYYDVPNSQIRQRASALPENIRIPTDQKVVPYFAGGLLLGSKGVAAITPAVYDGTQDLKPLYDIVSNSTNQIVFVVTATKRMLDTINYTPGEVSSGSWATWFQIYFEQPGTINDRASVTSVVSSDLQDRGIAV